uniref:Uncharacterized protein n=1 Tax=Ascaris lumbricoides TaxID=6252 RepID=A0A0M3HWQ7_ASCLU
MGRRPAEVQGDARDTPPHDQKRVVIVSVEDEESVEYQRFLFYRRRDRRLWVFSGGSNDFYDNRKLELLRGQCFSSNFPFVELRFAG